MFQRLKRRSKEPDTLDATFGGTDVPEPVAPASDEEPKIMPALADDIATTLHATASSFGRRDPAAPSAPTRFTYSTGDQPLSGYTIKRGIGVGGFGEVYFAISDAGKEVALKRIQRNLDIELRGVSHCMNLKHPNLISLYDTRYDEFEQAWVIMEFVPGATLRGVLEQHPQGLPQDQVLRWFGDLAAGVACLHDNGIVHRDLKPGNVFDDEGIVKLGDYGLSKFISCSRRGGHTESVGTFHYMAPEIGRGEYGKEIDIYALGIMLFEMLTGNVPFNGESSQEIIMKHLTSDPDLSDVPQPYRGVIAKALQKNPSSRQSSVVEMLAPLGIVIDQHGLARQDAESAVKFVSATIQPPTLSEDDEIVTSSLVDTVVPHQDRSAAFNEKTQAAFEQLQGAQPGYQTAPSANDRSRREEPIAQAVSQSARDLHHWWKTHPMSPVVRALVLVGAVSLVMMNPWLIPLFSFLMILYVPYYVIRALILSVSEQPSYATAHAHAVAAQQARQMQPTKEQLRAVARQELAAKSLRTRSAELTESWMSSLFVLALFGWVATMFGTSGTDPGPREIAPFVWGAVTALAGSWMMLAMGKLWEREEGEGLPRRIVQLGMGAIVGAFAFSVAKGLMIPLSEGFDVKDAAAQLPTYMYSGAGEIQLSAMMAHFAAVFFLLRWHRTADPLRSRRLGVWPVACAVVVSWAVHQVLPVPQPWGMLTAGATAVAIQMAAAWKNPMDRIRQPNPIV